MTVLRWITLPLLIALGTPSLTMGQPPQAPPLSPDESPAEIETPESVSVEPVAADDEITGRLSRIFEATGWFESVQVTTDQGVVFLQGTADSQTHQEWAERVAQRTSDVVAVVNQIEVRRRPLYDLAPAWEQLRRLGTDFVAMLPLIIVGILIVYLAYLAARLAARLARRFASRKLESQLLQQVIASVVAVMIVLLGLYIALKVSGLSRLAVTVLGGTGLVGLALGFAFRDIAENYLASILISLNRPFGVGDLIEVEGNRGFVRRVTTRGTLLLTIDGNHIQIPNSTVYKSIITNFSSSPRLRRDFVVGIGYDDSVTTAQEVIRRVMRGHDAVLQQPQPLVLVDSLGASTVNLRVLFWIDSKRFDPLSVSSAVMRLTKTALIAAEISMPDEAREVVFPHGVPLGRIEIKEQETKEIDAFAEQGGTDRSLPETLARAKEASAARPEDEVDATEAEGRLHNPADELQRHASEVERTDEENLIA